MSVRVNKWQPVADLLTHMADDDELLLAWGLRRYGDIRSPRGQDYLIRRMRSELAALHGAVNDRIDADAPTIRTT